MYILGRTTFKYTSTLETCFSDSRQNVFPCIWYIIRVLGATRFFVKILGIKGARHTRVNTVQGHRKGVPRLQICITQISKHI